MFNRLKKTAYAIVDNVAAELAVSDFVPLAFELEFGEKGALPAVSIRSGDTALRVGGKVDRVDGWLKDGKLYLRVVDYKTGKRNLIFQKFCMAWACRCCCIVALERQGLAALGGGEVKEIVGAGVEYLPARDAILTMDRGASEAQIADAMEKELKRSGMFCTTPRCSRPWNTAARRSRTSCP